MRLKMYVIKQRLTKMLNDKKQKQKWGQKLDGLQIRRLGGEVTKIPCPPLIPPFWPYFQSREQYRISSYQDRIGVLMNK